MEVHHHAHSHGKKTWKSYFWEFLMLFLAVFCGFLAEYQLEHKIEKDREKQFMKTMAEDLRTDTSRLNRMIKLRKDRIRNLDTLFDLIATDGYLANGRKVYDLYEFPYWDILRFFPSDRTMQQLKNGGNLRLIHKKNVSNALINYDVTVRNYKEYEPLQVELSNQINQHLEKLLDTVILEKSKRVFEDQQLTADTILTVRSTSREFPDLITMLTLTPADKKIFLKYIDQVKTLYLQLMRDHMLVKKRATETLQLVISEYNIK